MYHEFYGLRQAPFKITPDTRLFFNGGQRGEILQALVYAISSGEGIVKVVGEVGAGKTMLCRMLEVRLPDEVEIVYLPNPSLTPEDILHNIALEMGLEINPAANRIHVMQDLHHCLLERHANNQRVVVFVEEAQAMPLETLEEIRLLSNLETQQDKLLQIVLFGQPELDKNLNVRSIRQLRERITHSFNLPPLTAENIQEYVRFRLNAVGYRGPDMFDHGAYKAIAAASRGLTRRVNILADKSLLAAFAENTHNVSRKHALKAIADSEMKVNRDFVKPLLATVAGVAVVAVITWVLLSGALAPVFEAISTAWKSEPAANETEQVASVAFGGEVQATAPAASSAENIEQAGESATLAKATSDSQAISTTARQTAELESAQPQFETPEAADERSAVASMTMDSSAVIESVVSEADSVSPTMESSEPMLEQAAESATALPTKATTLAAGVVDASSLPSAEPVGTNAITLTPSVELTAEVDVASAASEQMPSGAPDTSADMLVPQAGTQSALENAPSEIDEQTQAPATAENAATVAVVDVATSSADDTDPDEMLLDVELPAGSDLLKQRLLAAHAWMASADRSNFTIQLLATDISQGASLEEFLRTWRSIGRLDRIYIYRTKIRGGVWFGVLYDEYETFSAAREALNGLPSSIKRHKPFIRNVRDIGDLG